MAYRHTHSTFTTHTMPVTRVVIKEIPNTETNRGVEYEYNQRTHKKVAGRSQVALPPPEASPSTAQRCSPPRDAQCRSAMVMPSRAKMANTMAALMAAFLVILPVARPFCAHDGADLLSPMEAKHDRLDGCSSWSEAAAHLPSPGTSLARPPG